MTASIRGVMTRLKQILGNVVVRILCGFHQLDLVMQSEFEAAFDGSFLSKPTKLIDYLRHQENLVARMKSECPKFCSVHWLSMGKVLDWVALHQKSVQDYLVQKAVSWASDDSYWIFLWAMVTLVNEANFFSFSLQGLSTLLVEQN